VTNASCEAVAVLTAAQQLQHKVGQPVCASAGTGKAQHRGQLELPV